MKNKIIKSAVLVCAMTLTLACNPKKEEVVIDKEQIKKEIQAKENEFAEVYNSGVIKSIGYYADDAKTFFQNRPPLEGKEAIVAFLKTDIDPAYKNKISFTTNEVHVSSDGNQVIEIGYFKVVDSTGTVKNTGNYMSLFEKRNGKYVCLRDMSASDMPLE
jgi:ketosteroid isomerase-like protein